MLKGDNKLFLFRFPTTTESVFEFKEKVEECESIEKVNFLLKEFDKKMAKPNRPHVLYQIGEDGSFHGKDTRFLAIPCTSQENYISRLDYNEMFFYELNPKSFAKIYELTIVRNKEIGGINHQNRIKITSEQYSEIGNACIDYMETIIKENINMVGKKTTMQLLVEASEELKISNQELRTSNQELRTSYQELTTSYQEQEYQIKM